MQNMLAENTFYSIVRLRNKKEVLRAYRISS